MGDYRRIAGVSILMSTFSDKMKIDYQIFRFSNYQIGNTTPANVAGFGDQGVAMGARRYAQLIAAFAFVAWTSANSAEPLRDQLRST